MGNPGKARKSHRPVRVVVASVLLVLGLIALFALNPAITASWLNLRHAGFIVAFSAGLWLVLEMLTAIPELEPTDYTKMPYRPIRGTESMYRSITGHSEQVEEFMNAHPATGTDLWTSSRPVHVKERQPAEKADQNSESRID